MALTAFVLRPSNRPTREPSPEITTEAMAEMA